ncbi:MAG: lipoprotein [Thiomicrorhabdus sp.]|nr:lipoprotein [Thiomicrorhabdus sp.]
MRMLTILSLLACVLTLSACGKKGPLYLPDERADKQTSHNQHNALRLQPIQEKS